MALGLLFSLPDGPAGLVASLQGMIFGAGILYLVGSIGTFLAGRDAMGGGDVAMMAMVGAFLGWESVCVTIFMGAVHRGHPSPVLARTLQAEGRPRRAGAGCRRGLRLDPEFKSREQLGAEGYLPFGVSLAIAAGILLVTDARWRIVELGGLVRQVPGTVDTRMGSVALLALGVLLLCRVPRGAAEPGRGRPRAPGG